MMHCTTTSHVWLWTGYGTSEGIPDHLPCQCHRYTAGEWYSLRAENARLTAQLAERDAEIKALVVRVAVLERAVEKAADWHSLPAHEFEGRWGNGWQDTSDGDDLIASDLRAALAARGDGNG